MLIDGPGNTEEPAEVRIGEPPRRTRESASNLACERGEPPDSTTAREARGDALAAVMKANATNFDIMSKNLAQTWDNEIYTQQRSPNY